LDPNGSELALTRADNGCLAAAVVKEHAVAGPHFTEGAQDLGVLDAIPHGFLFALEPVDGVGSGVCLGEEVFHENYLLSYCFSWGKRQNNHAATAASRAAPVSIDG
jgi:hypothetical protein